MRSETGSSETVLERFVAQRIEQRVNTPWVAGSNPAKPPKPTPTKGPGAENPTPLETENATVTRETPRGSEVEG
jgi:hypothetical protein